jgi:hypothetical protein
MICHKGGFPTIWHNEICDLTASLLDEVCHNVGIEPSLQPLSGKSFHHSSANKADDAREMIIHHKLIPAITGRVCSNLE